MQSDYDAILIVSFGGPEQRSDVIPFLENVLRGKPVPRERLLEVAEHYYHFDGVSPINGQVRDLIAALRSELDSHGIGLPIYWGNRNWHPLLTDTLREMSAAGVRHALAYATSAYSSYSSCRQYRENILQAQEALAKNVPQVDKIRPFFNHPLFVAANCERLKTALEQIPADRRDQVPIAFTAHSIPLSMAERCAYEPQLRETCRLVTEGLGIPVQRWQLAYQSRSGRPEDPWLDPDICDHLQNLRDRGEREVVVLPIGFLSDHLEVLYDLDVEARQLCAEIGLNLIRAATVGNHPLMLQMIRELIEERVTPLGERSAIGVFPARPDVCPLDCCPAPRRPPA